MGVVLLERLRMPDSPKRSDTGRFPRKILACFRQKMFPDNECVEAFEIEPVIFSARIRLQTPVEPVDLGGDITLSERAWAFDHTVGGQLRQYAAVAVCRIPVGGDDMIPYIQYFAEPARLRFRQAQVGGLVGISGIQNVEVEFFEADTEYKLYHQLVQRKLCPVTLGDEAVIPFGVSRLSRFQFDADRLSVALQKVQPTLQTQRFADKSRLDTTGSRPDADRSELRAYYPS